MQEHDPRSISFPRVRIKIDGANTGVHDANIKLRMRSETKHPQTLRIYWPTARFEDESHKSTTPSTSSMQNRTHFLQHCPPIIPRNAYGFDIARALLLPGTTESEDGLTIVASRHDLAAFRQETSAHNSQGQRLTRVETWTYHVKFPPGWIGIPISQPDGILKHVTFEFRNRENSSWEHDWKERLSERICHNNDWRNFWWEGFSDVTVPLSRSIGNPSAGAAPTNLTESPFASYPKPKLLLRPEDGATTQAPPQTPPQTIHMDDIVVLNDDLSGPTNGSSTTVVPDVSETYIPSPKELLEEAGDVFIRARMRELQEVEEDLRSYTS